MSSLDDVSSSDVGTPFPTILPSLIPSPIPDVSNVMSGQPRPIGFFTFSASLSPDTSWAQSFGVRNKDCSNLGTECDFVLITRFVVRGQQRVE